MTMTEAGRNELVAYIDLVVRFVAGQLLDPHRYFEQKLLGQLAAWLRLRFWLALFAGACLTWLSLLVFPGIWWMSGPSVAWVLPLVGAALSGYWSLGERSALLGLWYPVVLWMLMPLAISRRPSLSRFWSDRIILEVQQLHPPPLHGAGRLG